MGRVLSVLILLLIVQKAEAQQYFEGLVISESWSIFNEPDREPDAELVVEVRSQPKVIYPVQTGRLRVEMRITPQRMRRLAYSRGNEVPSNDRIIDFEKGYMIEVDHRSRTYHVFRRESDYLSQMQETARVSAALSDSGTTREVISGRQVDFLRSGYARKVGGSQQADSLLGLPCRSVQVNVYRYPMEEQTYEVMDVYTHAFLPVFIPEEFNWFEPGMASLRDAFTLYREIRTGPQSQSDSYRQISFEEVIAVEPRVLDASQFAIPEGYTEVKE